MKPRALMTLIAILAAVAGYFFLFEQRARRGSVDADRRMRYLLPYGPRDVDRAILINPHGDTIKMARGREGWLILGPVEDKGDTPAIDMFLHLIVPSQILAAYRDIQDLSVYGLASPFATLILCSGRHGRSDTIYVGDKSPTTKRAYVRLGGSRSVIIPRELTQEVVQKTLYELRDKHFMHRDVSDIISLTLTAPDLRLELSRSESAWLIGESALRADRALIEPYLSKLAAALIYKFAAEDPADSADFGIGDPPRDLLLRWASSETIRISFGRREKDFVPALRTGRGKIVMIKAEFLAAFDWIRDRLIRMNLSLINPDQTTGISWNWPDTALSFNRHGDSWMAEDETAAPVDGEALEYLLLLLRATTFESLADEAVHGVDAFDRDAALSIELRGGEGEILDMIRIARIPTGEVLASSLTAGTAGILHPGSFSEIERALAAIGR